MAKFSCEHILINGIINAQFKEFQVQLSKGDKAILNVFLSLLVMLVLIVWLIVGCVFHKPVQQSVAVDPNDPIDSYDTPAMRNKAADVVVASGYWCQGERHITSKSPFGLNPNLYEFSLSCDDGSRFARYVITMDPHTKDGTVRRDL